MAGEGVNTTTMAMRGCCLGLIFALSFVVLVLFRLATPGGGAADTTNGSNWTGSTDTVATLDGAKMPETSGKIGHEQHASKSSCFASGNTHFDGPLSFFTSVGSVTNCMAFGGPFTREQEEWYFNMRWDTSSGYPGNVKHKKVIITNPANSKRIVVSIEEYGPAARLKTRDGIVAGAPPEVYHYLKLTNPYTGNPSDKEGYATFAFAKDQNIPLGPLN